MASLIPAKTLGEAVSTAIGRQPITLLDALMGYVATFFHGSEQQQPQLKGVTMSGARAMRIATARRHLRAQILRPATLARHEAALALHDCYPPSSRRNFHNYFVTHLPSSSLHPDSRSSSGPHHKLPRDASTPHTPGPGSSPAVVPPNMPSRDLTVVRIPLRSAKHHFGASSLRGQRGYNEDTYQAGTVSMPAFAKRAPVSLVRSQMAKSESTSADSAFGDPQIFYFAVFDGHGGSQCSEFLRDELHGYIEQAATDFDLKSSLSKYNSMSEPQAGVTAPVMATTVSSMKSKKEALDQVEMKSEQEVRDKLQSAWTKVGAEKDESAQMEPLKGLEPVPANVDALKAIRLETELLQEYKNTVGGYFRRFRPGYFSLPAPRRPRGSTLPPDEPAVLDESKPITLESVLSYAFLRADLDFVTAQARKPDPDDPYVSDFPLNRDEILGSPHLPPSGHGIGGSVRFKGGSTASIALISTPTPAPFWHPAAHSTLVVAHVGDTRILLCETSTGLPRPLTSDHHPSSPIESRRLRRYAESLVTDSFGEERIQGLANSRAFGDMQSKRIGVSAEPDITRVDLGPAEYSFLVLMSDGVSGTLGDQEIVDVIKEARTPEEGSRHVVEYATEISADGDNATCLVVRLGGWERRSEGGLGSLGTKEIRDIRRAEALDPRRTGRR
ncbi:phosphatase 2C-like domain-containing protein [Podospora didyma]|uniref:Phosphatase 2C-like domain-containing protein n=1 Tax=Podospora didyma TaxID=330526 RepID=A0AAE0NTW3_9PEZI|nr:phosphatase 2C-like domain-containing protein [Podospora didyma]